MSERRPDTHEAYPRRRTGPPRVRRTRRSQRSSVARRCSRSGRACSHRSSVASRSSAPSARRASNVRGAAWRPSAHCATIGTARRSASADVVRLQGDGQGRRRERARRGAQSPLLVLVKQPLHEPGSRRRPRRGVQARRAGFQEEIAAQGERTSFRPTWAGAGASSQPSRPAAVSQARHPGSPPARRGRRYQRRSMASVPAAPASLPRAAAMSRRRASGIPPSDHGSPTCDQGGALTGTPRQGSLVG